MTQTTDNGWQQAILQNTRAIGILDNKVDTLTAKVEKIENEVSQLKSDVKEIKTDLSEIKEQLKGFLLIKVSVGTIALALVARLIGDYLLSH